MGLKSNWKTWTKGIQKEYNGKRLYKRNQNLTFVMTLNNKTLTTSEVRIMYNLHWKSQGAVVIVQRDRGQSAQDGTHYHQYGSLVNDIIINNNYIHCPITKTNNNVTHGS